MILNILHQTSDVFALAIVVIFVTAAMMVAPHFARYGLRIPKNDKRDEAAFDGYKGIMTMLGIVLAFSIVQVNKNLQDVAVTVGKEGAAFVTADRTLLRIGKPQLVAARPLLADYGTALINDEWPRLARGERSPAATAAYRALSIAVRANGPDDSRQQSMYNELLKSLDDLSDLREEILTEAGLDLPKLFWVTICGLLGAGFVLAGLTASSLSRTVGVGAPAAAVALLLAFVIIVDLPFEGETSVGPRPIQNALIFNAQRN